MTVNTNIGKITASKKTLSEICGAFFDAANRKEKAGFPLAGQLDRTTALAIYDALDVTGYFDDCKNN